MDHARTDAPTDPTGVNPPSHPSTPLIPLPEQTLPPDAEVDSPEPPSLSGPAPGVDSPVLGPDEHDDLLPEWGGEGEEFSYLAAEVDSAAASHLTSGVESPAPVSGEWSGEGEEFSYLAAELESPVPPPPAPADTAAVRRGRAALGEVILSAHRIAVVDNGRFTLADLSFDLREHEVAALVGPGAERLAQLLAGRAKPLVGRLSGPGWSSPLPTAPAAFNPRPHETVTANLALVHTAAGNPFPVDAAWEMASLFGLEAAGETKVRNLDPDEHRLLVLAASLSRSSGVCVVSRPTDGLEGAQAAAAEFGITELASHAGRAFFLLPASPEEAEAIATTIMRVEREVTLHQGLDDFVREHGPAARIAVVARSVGEVHLLVAICQHLGFLEIAIDLPARRMTAIAPAGPDDLVHLVDRAKAADIAIVSVALTAPTLAEALVARFQ